MTRRLSTIDVYWFKERHAYLKNIKTLIKKSFNWTLWLCYLVLKKCQRSQKWSYDMKCQQVEKNKTMKENFLIDEEYLGISLPNI